MQAAPAPPACFILALGSVGKTSKPRSQVKRIFVPLAESHGFSIDQRHAPTFITFRRTVDEFLHVLDLVTRHAA